MNIGVVGLGLIGGSLAKSLKKNTSHTVYGYDRDTTVTDYALLSGIIDGKLEGDALAACDAVYIALYPKAVVAYVSENASVFKNGSLVIDCAGVKRAVCAPCYDIAAKNGFHFIGGHPMAGTQYSGIKNAKDTMFKNACFVLVPRPGEDVNVLGKVRDIVIETGFSRITVMTPEKHDRLIAYTSQLAHVVSSAYIKSPSAVEHKGISAGSYKDMTRVAALNEGMWTELFEENSDNLLYELDNIIARLSEYRDALGTSDSSKLQQLLREGREAKERTD